MTILKIVELDDFSFKESHLKEKEVTSFLSYFMKPDVTNGLGSELSINPNNRIKHYIITEEIGGLTFIHNVLIMDGQEIFPISTKCRSIYSVYRKVYTEAIYLFLDMASEEALVNFYLNPYTPFEIIEGFFSSEIFTEHSSLDPENNYPIPENIYNLYEHSVFNKGVIDEMEKRLSSKKYQYYNGYIKNNNTLDEFVGILNDINELRFPELCLKHKKRYSDVSKINNLCRQLERIKINRLPYEDRLCIYRKDLPKIIERIGIYYPNRVLTIKTTELTSNKFINLDMDKFLRFCDYYLPENCEVIYLNNKCVKFTFDDEYFDSFWEQYKGLLPEMGYEGLLTGKINNKYMFLVSHLLQIVRKKTGIDSGRVPLIKINKSNDTVITLLIKYKNGTVIEDTWDLTMLLLADPLQYSAYPI